jgi:hypothetical protein
MYALLFIITLEVDKEFRNLFKRGPCLFSGYLEGVTYFGIHLVCFQIGVPRDFLLLAAGYSTYFRLLNQMFIVIPDAI